MREPAKINVLDYVEGLISKGKIEDVFTFLFNDFLKKEEVDSEELIQLSARFTIAQDDYYYRNPDIQTYKTQENRVIKALIHWAKAHIKQDLCWEYASIYKSLHIQLSLSELKQQLSHIAEHNGVEAVLHFLFGIVTDIELKRDLRSIEETLEQAELDLIDQNPLRHKDQVLNDTDLETTISKEQQKQDDFTKAHNRITSRLSGLIERLDYTHLAENWPLIFVNQQRDFKFDHKAKPLIPLISPLDVIQIPKHLSKKKSNAYKRLMIQAQDAYLCGNYKLAYQLCEEVRTRIEPESAQLYEYLFLTYYYLHRSEVIIEEALHDKFEKLRNLFLFANRFSRLQSILPDEAQLPCSKNRIAVKRKNIYSQTGERNIRRLNSHLLLTLADRYSHIRDQLLAVNEQDQFASLQQLIQCIKIGKEITRSIRVDAIFAITLVTELAGGGTHQWIVVTPNGELKNTVDGFDAIQHFRQSLRIIQHDDPITVDQVRDRISTQVLNALADQYYHLIQADVTPAQRQHDLTRLLVNFRVASQLFPAKTEFVKIPIQEFQHNSGLVSWFTLIRNRRLQSIETKSYEHYFDAQDFYQYFILKRKGNIGGTNWETEEIKLVKHYCTRLATVTETQYREYDDPNIYVLQAEYIKRIKRIASCYEQWIICYQASGDHKYLRYCYEELVGNKNFFWFSIEENQIQDHPLLQQYKISFYPKSELHYLSRIEGYADRRDMKMTVAENYLHKVVAPRLDHIRELSASDTPASEKYRDEIFLYLQNVYFLNIQNEHQSALVDFLYTELVEEKTMAWLNIENELITTYRRHRHPHVSAHQIIEDLIRSYPTQERFQKKRVIQKVAQNRARTLKAYYNKVFSLDAKKNYNKATIETLMSLIKRLRYLYEQSKMKACLEIPYNELVLQKGRLKWTYLGIHISKWWPLRCRWACVRAKIKHFRDFDYYEQFDFAKKEYK